MILIFNYPLTEYPDMNTFARDEMTFLSKEEITQDTPRPTNLIGGPVYRKINVSLQVLMRGYFEAQIVISVQGFIGPYIEQTHLNRSLTEIHVVLQGRFML